MPMDTVRRGQYSNPSLPDFDRVEGVGRKSYQVSVIAREVKKDLEILGRWMSSTSCNWGSLKQDVRTTAGIRCKHYIAFTDVVNKRRDAHIPVGDAAILVNNPIVPTPDDGGTRGQKTTCI